MAGISEIERLKQEISLQRVAESAGIALKRHGADLVELCSFHDDKTPSLVITPKPTLSALDGLIVSSRRIEICKSEVCE